MRDEIPPLIRSAREFVDHLAEFIRTTVPEWKAISEHIWDATNTDTIDNLACYVEELVGLDEIDELVSVAEWALSTVNGITPDVQADRVIAKRLTGATADVFREFFSRRDHHGGIVTGKIDDVVEEGSYDGS